MFAAEQTTLGMKALDFPKFSVMVSSTFFAARPETEDTTFSGLPALDVPSRRPSSFALLTARCNLAGKPFQSNQAWRTVQVSIAQHALICCADHTRPLHVNFLLNL